MVPACVLLLAGTPPGVRLECEQLAAVALNEVPRSAKHAAQVCTWSMVPACVLLIAGTPPGVRLECERLAAVALNEVPRLAKSKEL